MLRVDDFGSASLWSASPKLGSKVCLRYSAGTALHKKQGCNKLPLVALAFYSTCPSCVPRHGCSYIPPETPKRCATHDLSTGGLPTARVDARLRPQSDTVSRAITLFLPGFLRTRGRQAEKKEVPL